MPSPLGLRQAAATKSARPLLILACVGLVGACSPNQLPSSSPGTTPAVWTGVPGPSSAEPVRPGAHGMMARLRGPDGLEVATAKFDFGDGFATITIATSGPGRLAPGFHGVHIHQAGRCEPNSVGPTGGPPGDFLSAGGHFQAPGHAGEPASGDLTALQVRKDGTGVLLTTTDAFAMEDLISGEKTAIVIHAGADNFANIPADRYSQANGAPGPDDMTMTTGDAGKRVACGVIGAG